MSFYNNYIYSCNFFPGKKLFKLFISLECKYNRLQFGIRIYSIEGSQQKLCIFTAPNVYNKSHSKEIHPGATPFPRVKRFRVFSSKHWYLSHLPLQKSFQKLPLRPAETLLDRVPSSRILLISLPPVFCLHDRLTGSDIFIAIF